MAIEPTFTEAGTRKRFSSFLDMVEEKQIERLKMMGEMCVTHARSIAKEVGFEDQSGNLRSSIGYMLFKDGKPLLSEYEVVKGVNRKGKPMNGAEGALAGAALAKKVGEETKGICLVVTAGMHYARWVEAKGRVVITSAEHMAKRELPKMLKELTDSIRKAVS